MLLITLYKVVLPFDSKTKSSSVTNVLKTLQKIKRYGYAGSFDTSRGKIFKNNSDGGDDPLFIVKLVLLWKLL